MFSSKCIVLRMLADVNQIMAQQDFAQGLYGHCLLSKLEHPVQRYGGGSANWCLDSWHMCSMFCFYFHNSTNLQLGGICVDFVHPEH